LWICVLLLSLLYIRLQQHQLLKHADQGRARVYQLKHRAMPRKATKAVLKHALMDTKLKTARLLESSITQSSAFK
jgi:hypothetical protein